MGQIDRRRHLFLIGFSFGGKSTTGRRVARRLGLEFVDTDALIEAQEGETIPAIFRRRGEQAFRDLESAVLHEAIEGPPAVISTGGGIVLRRANRELMRSSGIIVCLQARTETIYGRAVESAARHGDATARPLLEGSDPWARIQALLDERRPFYAIADWIVQTDHLHQSEVAREVARGWHYCRRRIEMEPAPDRLPDVGGSQAATRDPAAAATVNTGSSSYDILVAPGLIDGLGERMRGLGLGGKAFVVGDDRVAGLYGDRIAGSLHAAGFDAVPITFPPGEASKTLQTLERVYDRMLEARVERRDTVVAAGGGVSGDLAGYAAATILRGINLVHLPTSLLAMVDSSIGGKTGVDHPSAKNMIGAFYQPKAVYCDVTTLETLPERDYAAGWAEVVKHAMILDAALFDDLEAQVSPIRARDPAVLTDLIARSARIKARIVSEDEREGGVRTFLNYGHTVGHALEAIQHYAGLLHGEAIAIGMHVAGRLSVERGLLPAGDLERQNRLLIALGLPVRVPPADRAALFDRIALDKKVVGGKVRWVLLERLGQATMADDVPREAIEQALNAAS